MKNAIPKLAIITTHPIQYNAPMFSLLAQRGLVQPKVFYTWGESVLEKKYDPGFGKVIDWDIPLLEGYAYEFVENISAKPGSHHFKGINNPGLVEAIKTFNPAAILVFGWAFKSHLKVMRYFHGRVPVLFRGDSILGGDTGLRAFIKKIFLHRVYNYADYALYVGQKNKRYFKTYGLKEAELIFAPHAVDNKRFSAGDRDCVNFKEKLGIKQAEKVFLYAGKLEIKKDPTLLLSAFQKAKSSHSHLVITGNGELENELRDLAGESANIHFLPFQNQSLMPALYRLADVFVLPSRGPGETWGLAVNEAMAAGRAVVVSNQCGCSADLVKNGENGFVFPAGDENRLRGIIEKLDKSDQLVKDMGKNAAGRIESWSFDNICKAIENLLKSKL